LRYFYRAQVIGPDVDWLKTNLGVLYGKLAYKHLSENKLNRAEDVYLQWIKFDPMNENPQSNLGVVYERQGREADTVAQYEKTMKLFPLAADSVFNLAVFYWHKKDWPQVVSYLEEVLRRKPDHRGALKYLPWAKRNISREPNG